MSFNILVKFFFIIILLFLLFYYGLVMAATRRAGKATTIPVPLFWTIAIAANITLIAGAIIIILLK